MTKSPKKYWKSLKYRYGRIVSDYDKSEWEIGNWRSNPYPVVQKCEGLNCCKHIVDAMEYVSCEVLAEVTIRGSEIVDDDKITAQEMKILRAWKWSVTDSVALSIYAAELVIGYYEKKYPNGNRPRKAIEAAKAYLQNPTSDFSTTARAAASAARAAADAAAAAYAATCAAASAARAASDAASDAACAAAASRAAAAAACAAAHSKKGSKNAREEMKKKIDKWIVARLETMEQIV